ncbi:stonustoxin subunit beta-like [Hoplias malabaricus]|uniref:stonustoxin subunit beta-like n=1 Tax=Hoplias malabaricus TaxID=27720 RepID=UPI003461D4B9
MITEEGCSYLYSALKNIQNQSLKLKELDLRYNHPGAKGRKKLFNKTEKLRLDHAGEDRIKSGPKKYACKLTLDPNTAHRLLSLSEGNRKVEGMKEEKSYPDHPERFSHSMQVLCRESLTGRCYWETEWNDGIGGGVNIAVAYKSVGRKCKNNGFGENEKSWSLSCCGRYYDVSHNDISTNIRPSSMPNRVGVYVDCEAGILSFYSVSTDTQPLKHIHTFTTTFTEPVYAGFRVWDSTSSVRLCQID